MRFFQKREFYIPKTAKLLDSYGTDATVYVYDENHGRPLMGAIAFHGNAQKPDWHLTFKTEERRAKHIADYIAARRERAGRKAKDRAERAAWVPDYKVGDILHTCWGYDQTNVEFFEVIEVRGKHLILREVCQESEATGFMQGKCVPVPGKYPEPRYDGDDRGKPIRRLAQQHGIKIDDVRTAFRTKATEIAGCKVYSARSWSSYA